MTENTRRSSHRWMRRGAGAGAVALVAATTLLASCGMPTDDAYKPISAADLPFGLADTTTTSTTTTTLPPATTTTTILPTTTTAPTTAPVQVYFVAGTVLRPVTRQASLPVTPPGVLTLLQAGPAVTDSGLRSSIPPESLVAVRVSGGKATVDLAPASLDQPGQEQLFAFAQIVATLTRLPGIGQVEFNLLDASGNRTVIQALRGTGDTAAVVSRDDYANLLPGGI